MASRPPLFDLVLLGYRNDLARERTLAHLHVLAHASGAPAALGRDAELPRRLRVGIDHEIGLRLLGELRELGAQVRLVPSETSPPPEPDAPARPRLRPPLRLALLFAFFGASAAVYLHVTPRARPLPPAGWSTDLPPDGPVAIEASRLADAPHRLNDETVALNASGQFADAAARLRRALAQQPDEPALRRNLKVVLHNWAVSELNAGRIESAIGLLEEGLAIEEDAVLLGALGIAHARRDEWDAARPALERAVELGANDRYTLLALGNVYRAQGNRAAAVDLFHRAREQGAGGAEFDEMLARLERDLDAEWDFAEMHSPHFQVSFAGGESDAVAQVVSEGLESAYFHVGRKLELYPAARVPVVLYPSEDFHDITQTPNWTSGIYDGRIKLPVRGLDEGDAPVLERTLRHEYGHVLVTQLSRGRAPVWLNEGISIWAEEDQDGERAEWAYAVLAGEVLFNLAEIEGPFTGLPAERVNVAYAQSYLAVRSLVDHYGVRGTRQLLGALAEGASMSDAFRSVFARDLAAFESEFVRQLVGGG